MTVLAFSMRCVSSSGQVKSMVSSSSVRDDIEDISSASLSEINLLIKPFALETTEGRPWENDWSSFLSWDGLLVGALGMCSAAFLCKETVEVNYLVNVCYKNAQ